MDPDASVIIPARNAASTLPACLLALRAQTVPRDRFEVLVVDDGSIDNTAVIAKRYQTQVLSIPNSGPAVARNRGVEQARGGILVFTDSDCAPEPGFLEAMLRPFDEPDVVATKGIYRTDQKTWTARFVQAEYESRYRLMGGRETIDFVDTYAAAYRRDAFESVGGFDESFPLPSVEDQELSFRMARTGARMVFCPEAVVTHRHAADLLTYFKKKVKIGFWKMRVMARFPDKLLSDSHTPSSLKIEILLIAAILMSLPLSAETGRWWLPVALVLAFVIVVAPFCVRRVREDAVVAAVSPVFLFVRGLALGAGMTLGIFRGQFTPGSKESMLSSTRLEAGSSEQQACRDPENIAGGSCPEE